MVSSIMIIIVLRVHKRTRYFTWKNLVGAAVVLPWCSEATLVRLGRPIPRKTLQVISERTNLRL